MEPGHELPGGAGVGGVGRFVHRAVTHRRQTTLHPVASHPEVRDAWLAEVVAREVLEAAGEVVRPERRDVGLIAWAVVWTPEGSRGERSSV